MKKGVLIGVCVCMALFFINEGQGFADPFKKIVLFPFHIQAETDLSFLQEGIKTMITTRLESLDQFLVVDPKETKSNATAQTLTETSQALSLGKNLSADFILTGSVIVLGEKVSTDIRLINVNTGKNEISFSRLGNKKEDVLVHVDMFYEALITHFSLNGVDSRKDALLKTKKKENEKPFSAAKSQTFDFTITGVSAGPVFGKPKNEIVFTDGKAVYVYDSIFETPRKLFEYKEKGNTRILGVDAADMDEEGHAEIYVTAIYENSGDLKSFVLEWQGDHIEKTTDNEKWYLRVIDSGVEKKILLGQKRGNSATLFHPDIYEMAWKNKSLVPVKKLNVPNKMVLFGFATGDVLNTGKENRVSLNKEGHVVVYQEEGKIVWTSPELYGGSENYINNDPQSSSDDRFNFYLPQRVFISDMDQNGQKELILVSNHEKTGRIFSRMRYFDKGYIESLVWSDIGFKSLFKTQEISGYISDYIVGDFNQNSKPDILFSVVTNGSSFFDKKTSYLVLWE